NSPFVVLGDAVVDRAVDAAIFGKYVHNGQICMATNRIIVHQDVYDEFVEKFVTKAKGLQVGDPKNPETVVGPIINKAQADKIMGLAEEAKKDGLRVALDGGRNGNVMSPIVFADVANDCKLAQSEIISPIATIIQAKSDDEALAFANDTEYGLSSTVFTSDLEKGQRFALHVDAGM